MTTTNYRWPEGALVYHIYPRSFQDSNNDGIGDLRGVMERLDYLVDMGVTAIWLSPFYPSPMADFGYDVADYCNVDPVFGTLDDFKALLHACADHDIKVMVDLVPNHTSDEHEWFKKSRSTADYTENPYSDWYIWRDGLRPAGLDADARPLVPNNWRDALTGGSAWEWDDSRGQYYLHSFDVKQPDLNWSNRSVRTAIKDVMRFWLDLGVDGFRVDAVYWMAKEPLLSDDALNPEYVEGEDQPYESLKHDNSRGWPAVYAYLSEMADVLHEEPYQAKPRFMVTEAYPEGHNPVVEYLNFYIGMDPQVAAPFNFEGLSLPWQASPWRKFLRSFHSALDQIDTQCVASYAFGNHDQSRIASRIGPAAARSAAVLLLTLPGMAFLYYGDELGMHDVTIPADRVQDPAAKGDAPRNGRTPQGRDPERTPMQWSTESSAGFTATAEPWLPLADDYQTYNVVSEMKDPASQLNLYRQLGQLRKSNAALRYGDIRIIETASDAVLAFVRISEEDTAEPLMTIINFSDSSVECQLSSVQIDRQLISSVPSETMVESSQAQNQVADSSQNQQNSAETTLQIGPHEAALYVVQLV